MLITIDWNLCLFNLAVLARTSQKCDRLLKIGLGSGPKADHYTCNSAELCIKYDI